MDKLTETTLKGIANNNIDFGNNIQDYKEYSDNIFMKYADMFYKSTNIKERNKLKKRLDMMDDCFDEFVGIVQYYSALKKAKAYHG